MLMSQAFKIQVHKATSLICWITVCSLLKCTCFPIKVWGPPSAQTPQMVLETEGDIPVHSSDAGVRPERGQSTQLPPEAPCSQTYTTQTAEAKGSWPHPAEWPLPGSVPQRSKGFAKTKGPQHHKQQPGGSISALECVTSQGGAFGPWWGRPAPGLRSPRPRLWTAGTAAAASQRCNRMRTRPAFIGPDPEP